MKGKLKKFIFVFVILVFAMTSYANSFAHQGRTDSSGGHRDNQNKSGLGSYHYHCDGNPPHLHEDGYCPYSSNRPNKIVKPVEKAVEDEEEVTETFNESTRKTIAEKTEEKESFESSDEDESNVLGTLLLCGAGWAGYKKFKG